MEELKKSLLSDLVAIENCYKSAFDHLTTEEKKSFEALMKCKEILQDEAVFAD